MGAILLRPVRDVPPRVVAGDGPFLTDEHGRRYLDACGGAAVSCLGHSHPAIVEAVAEQIHRGTHYGAGHDIEVEWGERVCQLVPSIERVEFTSSGPEPTPMAMRLARASPGREKILKFAGHFHGWQDYAIPGERLPVSDAPSPGAPRSVFDTVAVAPVNVLAFVDQQLSGGEIAAVILEPSGASWASIPLPDGFLTELREITKRHNTLLIFDEVITGFRWAAGGAQELARRARGTPRC